VANEIAFTTWQTKPLRDTFVLSCHARNVHAKDVIREMMIAWLERQGIDVPNENRAVEAT
jgi:hypothetical protein